MRYGLEGNSSETFDTSWFLWSTSFTWLFCTCWTFIFVEIPFFSEKILFVKMLFLQISSKLKLTVHGMYVCYKIPTQNRKKMGKPHQKGSHRRKEIKIETFLAFFAICILTWAILLCGNKSLKSNMKPISVYLQPPSLGGLCRDKWVLDIGILLFRAINNASQNRIWLWFGL